MFNLHKPYISGTDYKSIESSIKSGWVSSAGPMIKKFEQIISKFTRSKHVIACSTGTSALHISLKIMNFNKNEEIIVPSLTFIASVNSIIYNNLSPFFFDNNNYYTIDEINLLKYLTTNTKRVKKYNKYYLLNKKTLKIIRAIMLVHTFGNAVDIEKIYNFCKKNNIIIIEDAAESLGTFYKKGKFKNYHTGTVGLVGCLSFNGNKIVTTGSGGAILTNDNILAKRARYFINQSKNDRLFYIHNEVGYNYRMNNLQASFGCSQFNKLKKILKLKKKIHNIYKKNFNDENLNISSTPEFCISNNWLNILQIKKKLNKNKLTELILELEKKGIETRPLWYPNHKQKPFKKYEHHNINFLNKIYYNRLCLPSSPDLTINDIKYISKQIKTLLSKI